MLSVTALAEVGAEPAVVQGTVNVRYSYDALGRLTKVEDDNGQTTNGDPDYDFSKVEHTYTWSGTNQLVEEKHTFDGNGPYTVKSTIDDVGVRTSLEYPHASGESYRTLSFTADELRENSAIPAFRPRAHDAAGAFAWPDAQPCRRMPSGRF